MFTTQIDLFGEVYLLIGNIRDGGAICTKDQYINFEESFAHLYSNGEILRHGKLIGNRNDIEVLKTKIEVHI